MDEHCTSKHSHKLDAPEYPLEVRELLAEARSLEDSVSSELKDDVVFLALAGGFELAFE